MDSSYPRGDNLKLRVKDVFIAGALPIHTYIFRKSEFGLTYEFRLQNVIDMVGFLTSIVGPSKTGKTVLCDKVIGQNHYVDFIGNDFKDTEDFWVTIANRVGISLERDHTEIRKIEGQGLAGTKEEITTSITESFHSNKDKVIQYFINNDLVLLLDDFHYASSEKQLEIAYQLKDAIRKGFRTIIISLPHRSDDAIRKNTDLGGRLNLINIEPWNKDELREIAVAGFGKLDMEIDLTIADNIAQESLSSPQLMQSICYNLGMLLNIDNTATPVMPDQGLLVKAYRMTSLNLLAYQEVARKLKTGPNPRGQKRKTYMTIKKEEVDIYELLLKAIAEDPPTVSLSTDSIKRRIDVLLGDAADKPDRVKIKTAIDQVQSIIQSSEPVYQVFEYKDDEVYILEPLFLFYLRWGIL
ncbi:ATP-binding protein [Cohnella nanjingensis]|uniref:ATP-binding protein n=2 Tax=Cohnella nanjingensis TaxID=1387779 RepID=A0A7X0RRE3_9BACL|nr:ATP-binding protein [Cohnella nanjingensis]